MARKRPEVVTLCGSMRFAEHMRVIAAGMTVRGIIVLRPEVVKVQSYPEGTDAALDALHLHKIDMADKIYVVNVGGYIGESTANEIEYARHTGKAIEYMEEPS